MSPSQRRRVVELRVRLRQPTSRWRSLPVFLVIGAQRSGTSSLYRYLAAHPNIGRPLRKEVGYFSRRYEHGLAWYRAHFPLRASRRVAFEATPDYLLHPHAPTRAADVIPDVRLIVLLRDPVERAYSHYRHMRRLGFEDRSFEEALDREPERIHDDVTRLVNDPLHDCRSLRRFSYVTRGRYADQLERWLAVFPRQRFLLVSSEGFFSEPAALFAELLDFLGLPRWLPDEFRNFSEERGRTHADPTGELTPEVRDRLAAEFRPTVARLREIAGWEAPWAWAG